MAIVEIPLRSDISNYDFNIDINGNSYFLELKYNLRMTIWSISIFNSNKEIILGDIPLLTETDIKGQYGYIEELFPGLLFMFDIQGEQKNADNEDIGGRIILVYDEVV